ncbi:hypothetical protein GGI12_004728 [Dipsacomyces acuminosporus]|nr:hypothetical protein GGI12_004728 [Dipsacomyces acuminosporus]
MGWDTIIRFFDPKYYKNFPQELDEFFGNGGRIAYSRRVGFSDKDVEAFFSQPMMDRYNQYIYEITLPKRVKHISSSGVREAIRNGAQFVDDVPPRILGFVNDQMLYRE